MSEIDFGAFFQGRDWKNIIPVNSFFILSKKIPGRVKNEQYYSNGAIKVMKLLSNTNMNGNEWDWTVNIVHNRLE